MAARRLLSVVLDGVGIGETVEQPIRVCLHHRRSLNDSEIGTLSPAWLAIPARDEFAKSCGVENRL